jgi:hypothetical protein
MRESIRLPEALTATSIDVEDLVSGIGEGTVGLDWTDVKEVDPEVVRALLEPFRDRLGELGDALGIWSMNDSVEPWANWVMGLGPEPSAEQLAKVDAGSDTEPEESAGDPCQLPDFDLETPAGVRDALHRLVALDLLGPACGPEEELVHDPPKTRYVVGTLAPKRDEGGAAFDGLADDDSLGGAGERSEDEGPTERVSPVSDTLFASSIGMTFVVAAGVPSIRVRVSWGAYDRVASEVHETDTGAPKMVWKRSPRGGEPFDIALGSGPVDPVIPDPEYPDVWVKGVVRPADSDGSKVVTLFLVNDQVIGRNELLKDRKWVFQPEILVTATDEASAVFVRRDHLETWDPETGDLEEQERAILSMVYRKHAEFAVGHGVGVHALPAADPWLDPEGHDRATAIRTAVLPWYDVPVTEMPTDEELEEDFPGFSGFELDMKVLAELPREELAEVLARIPDTYGRWIEAQRARVDAGEFDAYKASAELALEKCERVRERLAEGVDLIRDREDVYEAFGLANRAMRLQRLRSVFALHRRRGEKIGFDEVEASTPARWRAFQLAFIVLNIPTVARLDHPRRTSEVGSYADLLWFPTGGGKTEAYLGVAAFAIGIRRLQGMVGGFQGDGGVTVIMRYTLRLLTLQQFQRAAGLVCALEFLRQADNDMAGAPWGQEPFRIGLWVGNRSTPGTTDAAARWVNQMRGSRGWHAGAGTSSPLQLTNCPWCGTALGPDHVEVETHASGRGRTLLCCPDRDCDFNRRNSAKQGLPVLTVDEEIYRLLPTFLLATVDKFAQMPWRGEVQALFGRVAGRCDRHGWLPTEAQCTGKHNARGALPASTFEPPPPSGLRPPDLIIQDELHLISGPLGTLVGLYETAIDDLCTWTVEGQTIRPKVIASTATTRRAPEQVHRLFSRQVEIFPPPGLEAADNFFARQRRPDDEKPGRRYMGVCSPGRSRPAVLIRVYVAILAAAEWLWSEVADDKKELVDPYMTLLGYFNSLRELGGMRRLVDDDVSTRAFRVERGDRPGMKQRKMFPESTVAELTSRIRSSQIPEILDRLDDSFVIARAQAEGKGKRKLPLDAVLATNMVSVGVDVQRLGTMVVSGQPKATAEYIQATSRVGRSLDKPGFIVTVLNWARPRDLSHYEQFEQFHAVFYRYVEALSVTPFAPRALDRGLTGVVSSLVRLRGSDLNPNHGAGKVQGAGQLPEVIDALADRAQNTALPGESDKDFGTRVRQAVAAKLDDWGAEAGKPNRKLGYRKSRKRDDVTVPLLEAPGLRPWGPFTVPTSMREVEPGVGLVLGSAGAASPPPWVWGPAEGDEEVGA